jgi:uncharacterized membrane protein YfcA
VISPDSRLPLAIAAAALAGIVNSIAGGGTLLTFPALLALGVSPAIANATSTVALLPGALSSMLGYRRELRGVKHWARAITLPSVVGGALGAWAFLATPPREFARLVPWLVLGATLLFMVNGAVMRRVRRDAGTVPPVEPPRPTMALLVVQLFVGIYGGYFGAGVGILMLASLGFSGFTNIHRMNGLKNWGGFCMNFVATLIFAFTRRVDWPIALAMALAAVTGGYVGSRLAQHIGPTPVRRAVVGVGLVSGVWMLLR